MKAWSHRKLSRLNQVGLVLALAVATAAASAQSTTNKPPAIKPLPTAPNTQKKTTTPAKPAPAKPAPAKPTPPKPTPPPAKPAVSEIPPVEAFEAAEKIYQEGKYEEALAAFRAFIAGKGRVTGLLPGALYYEGWSAYNLRRFDEAAQAFGKLIDQYKTHALVPEAILKRAECLRELKEFPKSIETYTQFLSNYSTNQFALMAQLGIAWSHFGAKDFPAAKAQLAKYRDSYPLEWQSNFDGLFLLALIFTEENNHKAAQEIYELIATQSHNPRATEALYLAAESSYEAKQYLPALRYYKRVQPTAALLANIDQQIAFHQANRAALITQLGMQGFQARVEGLQRLRTQVTDRPDLRTSALFRIANCYQQLERPEEAGIVYRHLIEKYNDPKIAAEAQFALIQTLTVRKKMAEANAETEILKQKYPEFKGIGNAKLIQAENSYKLKQYQQALELFGAAKAEATDPAIAESVDFRIASCYYEMKDFEKAREGYAAFLEKHKESKALPDALFRLSRVHFALSDATKDLKAAESHTREAIKYMEQVRTEHPLPEAMPDVLFQLGYLYSYLAGYEAAAYEKSLEAFDAFIEQFPLHKYSPEVAYQRARVLAVLQRHDDAIAAFRSLIENHADHALAAQAAYEIGTTLYGARRRQEMVTAFREYAEKFPQHGKVGDARYAIGLEFEDQGRQLVAAGAPQEATPKFDEAIAAYRGLIEEAGAAGAGDAGNNLRNAAIEAQKKLAVLLEERGLLEEAIAGCEKFLVQFADNPVAARQMIGHLLGVYRKGRKFTDGYAKFDALRQQFQANSAIRISSLTSIVELGLTAGDYLKANQAAAQLLVDPDADKLPALTYVALGKVLLETQQFDRAREAFEKMRKAFEDDPMMNAQAALGMARAQLGQKQYDEAEKAFKDLTQVEAKLGVRADAELGLARVYKAKGKMVEAIDLLNKVLPSRGDASFEAAFELGHVFLTLPEKDAKKKKDNTKAALAYFARLFFAPAGPMADEAAYQVPRCHELLGNPAAARAAYQNYVKRYPDGKFSKQAEERIKALTAPAK